MKKARTHMYTKKGELKRAKWSKICGESVCNTECCMKVSLDWKVGGKKREKPVKSINCK